MNIEELAQFFYEEVNFSHNICISFLKHWIKKNILILNQLLSENFEIVNGEIIAPMDAIQIFKKMHEIENFKIKENQSLNMVIDKNSYPKINRNAVQKSYLKLKKEAQKDLEKMIKDYKNKEKI